MNQNYLREKSIRAVREAFSFTQKKVPLNAIKRDPLQF
jgi:hypothetical protein